MGQIAAAIVILAGAVALNQGIFGRDTLTPAGIAGMLLLVVGGALYLAETARAWRQPRT